MICLPFLGFGDEHGFPLPERSVACASEPEHADGTRSRQRGAAQTCGTTIEEENTVA